MNPRDLFVLLGSGGVLGAGLGGAVLLARLGVPTTYVRDLVHVGTGIWVLSWPFWSSPLWPIAITASAALVTLMPPRPLVRALSGRDEAWTGIVVYVFAYLVLTTIGLVDDPFPAAAGLLALSFGDGVGGLVGRRFGKHGFQVRWGKKKSLEGSITVTAFAAIGIVVAARWFAATASPGLILVAAAIAGISEALAPRSSDNALVPLSVWLVLRTSTLSL